MKVMLANACFSKMEKLFIKLEQVQYILNENFPDCWNKFEYYCVVIRNAVRGVHIEHV